MHKGQSASIGRRTYAGVKQRPAGRERISVLRRVAGGERNYKCGAARAGMEYLAAEHLYSRIAVVKGRLHRANSAQRGVDEGTRERAGERGGGGERSAFVRARARLVKRDN